MWTAKLEEDSETGELVLPLDPEALSQMGWDVGDELVWTINEDSSVTIEKIDD